MKNNKIIKSITTLFILIFITGCMMNSIENKAEGLWAVDISDDMIEKNGWHDIGGNTFYLRSDFSCSALIFKDPNHIIKTVNEKGTWQIIQNENGEAVIDIDVPGNPMNGKYKIEFYRDYTNKLLKMKLSNSTTEFTCAKFFQNFDRIKNW